jgi:phospholipase C
MRFIARVLLSVSLAAGIASASTLPTFKHVVIIVQENRTPDNLFGSGSALHHSACGQEDPFEAGVDIENGGPNKVTGTETCLTSFPLNVCWDPIHTFKNWNDTADIQANGNVNLDGACVETPSVQGNCTLPPQQCPTYSYVQKTDVQPYLDIATNYGFANYMFSTHEGPSFPAHQFLLSGTSAPVAPGITNYLDFAADNAAFYDSGCPDTTADPHKPECYEHNTLVDLLDAAKLSWRYYTPQPGIIWTAINAIKHLCYTPGTTSGPCNTSDWKNNVIFPTQKVAVPFLQDVQNCNLQNVSWVIPDERWSDHPGNNATGGGPPMLPI